MYIHHHGGGEGGGGGESIIHKNQQNLAQCKVTKSMSPMGCLSPPSPLEWGDNSGTVYT